MNVDWHDLLNAVALYFVLEGILPFVSPARFRHFTQLMAQFGDHSIRKIGLISMAIGVALLSLV